MRIAPTFMRFGSFEIFKGTDPYSGAAGPSNGLATHMAPKMADYLLAHFFSEIPATDAKYEMMFERVVVDTA